MVKISTNIMNFLKNLFYTKDEVNTQLSNKANTSHSHSDDDVSVTTANYGEGINQNTFNGYLSYDMLTVKDKLNGIDEGANKTTVDSSLSTSSTNPVQNKVIQTALDEKANTEHTHADYDISTDGAWEFNEGLTSQFKINNELWEVYDKVNGIDNNANNYSLPTASSSTLGGVKVGTNLSIDDNGILSATDTTYGAATLFTDGLMSGYDKGKLDGIAINANNYSLPTASSSTLGGVKVGTNLSISNGVLSATNTTYGTATTSANGLMSSSDKSKLDGIATGANKITVDSSLSSSSTNPVQNKVINSALSGKASTSVATTSANGLMSSSDKSKLNGIATGATKVTVDSSLSSSSTNPVQNKVINSALAGKAATSHVHGSDSATYIKLDSEGTMRLYTIGKQIYIEYEFTKTIASSGWTNIGSFNSTYLSGKEYLDFNIKGHSGQNVLLSFKSTGKVDCAYGPGYSATYKGVVSWFWNL